MATIAVPPNISPKKQVVTPLKRVVMLDVSEAYRPEGKNTDEFRIYDEKQIATNPIMKRVYQTYLDMHTNQTMEFVLAKHEQWLKFDHAEMDVMEALELLNSLVDASDPDVDVPNIVHAFQTAERIREKHPEEDWFQLTGLIHDLGKVMALWGEEQWATVGDTFAVGCLPGKSIVFRDSTFDKNPDMTNSKYNTPLGVYQEGCGIDNLMLSWGHDEYLYRILKNHKRCTLPDEAFFMIRFHSFYPWHTGKDYWQFMSQKDHEMYHWLMEFNKFDLYSKSDSTPDIEKLKPYYQSLVDKYVPGLIKF